MENNHLIPLENICSHYQVEISFIHSLREYGLMEIHSVEGCDYMHPDHISAFEKMMRMHYDLEINFAGLDAISHLLHRMHALEQELNSLRNRLRIYEND